MPEVRPVPSTPRNAIGWFATQLRARFYLGKIGSGDRLPSVRALAQDLGVSPTTTLELYRALESQGIVEGRQRSGMFLRTVGVEPERPRDNGALFQLVAATASKLRGTGASAGEFTRLLLRYMGDAPRADFRIAFVGSQESLELVQKQLAARLRFAVPMVAVSPSLSQRDMRARLASLPHVRCLLATFLGADVAVRLANDLDVPLVIVRLSSETAEFLQPPPDVRRFVVVRDRDTAESLRRLFCALCHVEHRSAVCPLPSGGESSSACKRAGQDPRAFVQFASLDEEASLAQFEREADTVHAPETSIVQARARFVSKKVAAFPVTMSEHTVNDVLYHYLFAEQSPAIALGGRRA